ncbi:hypothetical protein ACHQM5_018616 [Ranunculus cassubicifolius]
METGDSSGVYDKTKVLDVKPLRCLAPVFPPQSSVPNNPPMSSPSPFVSVPPFSSAPAGYTPFYPFHNNNSDSSTAFPQQNTKTTPVGVGQVRKNVGVRSQVANNLDVGHLNKKLKTQTISEDSDDLDSGSKGSYRVNSVGEGTSNGGKKSGSQKKVKRVVESRIESLEDGDSESVGIVRMKYDALRRRITQTEEITNSSKRGDLKANTIMMNKGLGINRRKRIGSVPGIEVGDIFFFRIEMCLIGLHAPSMAGIDYMIAKFGTEDETVAVSIVSSGGYEDDVDDKDVLIYSGQGGVSNKKDGKEIVDQKLERGNLALERSVRHGNEVRVIRGMKDPLNTACKIYVYDGLYKIHESWTERGKSGGNVFKYKLLRIPGQPEAFSIWKSIQQWKDNTHIRPGLILPDLTSGAEKLPVSLVNDIDDDKGPAHFTYSVNLKYSKPISSLKPSVGCTCHGSCLPANPNCSCATKNGGQLPHTLTGLLVVQKDLIYECNQACKRCFPNCKNQVTQNGLRVRLEVFKTSDRGWGLRSWDAIRAGTFICEYTGEVMDATQIEVLRDQDGVDDYIFDSTCDIDSIDEWNYVPDLLGEKRLNDSNGEAKSPLSLVINATNRGNVARFMNHSCSPNVFWQPVLYDHNEESLPHVAFYAMKHIPPLTELTYDYGVGGTYFGDEYKRKTCLCGSMKCRGYFH